VSGRSYLSIGDVLALLRQEFPDVTISKIRFLESQGLVDPERTPSGYRKFYEDDVERLRWVLRQQREHFLPLKVIKGRLDERSTDEGNGLSSERPAEHPAAGQAVRGRDPSRGGHEEVASEAPVLVAHRAEPRQRAGAPSQVGSVPSPHHPAARRLTLHGEERSGDSDDATPAGPVARSGPEPARAARGVSAVATGTLEETRRRDTAPDSGARASSRRLAEGQGAFEVTTERQTGRTTQGATESATAERDRSSGASLSPGGRTGRPPDTAGDTRPSKGKSQVAAFSGVSMSLEELAQASGLEKAAIEELESFGLVSSRTIGGIVCYDEEALVVAQLAAAFAVFGVEARHLRLHLLSAQREAGFIEQVILPLLKQRNPTSRMRAHETASELSRLGRDLRGALLERNLRELLGG
jgi:DNA-binding transcriptional MerR regulator